MKKESSTQQITEIRQHLAKSQRAQLPFQSEDADFLTTNEVANRLFGKAPPEVLNERTLEDLVQITDFTLDCLEDLLANNKNINILSRSHGQHCSLAIAQGDRPFIINTISEILREEALDINLFLHPILNHKGYHLSLAYLEFEAVTKEKLKVIVRKLESALTELKVITDDFTSMLVKTETLARILSNPKYTAPFPRSEQLEVSDFLHWLTDGGFIFLGHAEWKVADDQPKKTPDSLLGIFKTKSSHTKDLLTECTEDALKLLESQEPLQVTKLRIMSTVHRRARYSNITILELSSDGRVQAVHSLIGLFTSKALTQESSSVPLIRRKLKLLTETEDLYENSFDYKTTINIIDSMPKDEAFRLDLDSLREIVRTIVGIQNKNETRVSIRFDSSRRGVSVLIIMPRDRFNTVVRDRLQQHLEDSFGAAPSSSEYHLDLTNKPHARLYFYLPSAQGHLPPLDLPALEQDIATLSQTWQNLFEDALHAASFSDPDDVVRRYGEAFAEDYQALYAPLTAVSDVQFVERLTLDSGELDFNLQSATTANSQLLLVMYHRHTPISLSRALPILENMGFEVISEQVSCVEPLGSAPYYVQRYTVNTKNPSNLKQAVEVSASRFETVVKPTLLSVFNGSTENDILNSLSVRAGLSVRQIAALRTYSNFLWQVSKFATRSVLYGSLSSAPEVARKIWDIFDLKFNPELKLDLAERSKQVAQKISELRDALRQIKDITADRVLRSITSILEHTLRTNYYTGSETIVVKLHSANIEIIPQPRPLYELFASSIKIQGTHLRSGKIARGGIRWSDRYEDFRSEVLGLIKTQRIKNALIVPTGAKGGFIVHNLPEEPAQMRQAVAQGYSTYIRALLTVADNRIDGKVVHPDQVLAYDGEDPYFVVAADKGTATFSDLANAIATKEFNLWIGDAFASGGSQGYDHKKYGITARGAWESVKRHFKDLGINYEESFFTAVGIGDMSGDVFGNGLLLSNKVQLLGAFNHKHIFIDPNPDPERSFAERQRLFTTPGSQWSDYNPKLISPGGQVYNRFDKEITLSPEVRKALGLDESVPAVMNGEEVITHILKAPVDLLWSGGIGTYVKSSDETHAEVNDGTNDRVRINATELRARVVGEGGNLGFTQSARIQFSEHGGCINTDAIDNSGGVDLSDHEVNLKILMALLEDQRILDRDERDSLLLAIAEEVTEHVLQHNRNHAMVLSLGVFRSKRNISYFRSLIKELHKNNYINRSLEYLPDDEDLVDRANNGRGLERPELAVCLAGVKLLIKDELNASNIINDPLAKNYLYEYFPEVVQKNFQAQIDQHPLARNIIITQITNSIVDTMGVTFVHRMGVNYSQPTATILCCAIAAETLLQTHKLLRQVQVFDNFKDNKIFLELRKEISGAMREASSWLIRTQQRFEVSHLVGLFQEPLAQLFDQAECVFYGEQLELYKQRLEEFSALRLPEDSVRMLAAFPWIEQIFEMLWIAKQSKTDSLVVANTYSQVSDLFDLGNLQKLQEQIPAKDKWEVELISVAFEDLKHSVSVISQKIVQGTAAASNIPAALLKLKESHAFDQFNLLRTEILEKPLTAASISVLAKNIKRVESGL